MRVQSNRPLKNGGYLHPLDSKPVKLPQPKPEPPAINATKMLTDWLAETEQCMIERLAERLGVTPTSLAMLNCAWSKQNRAWAFPMRDGFGEIIGIRLRSDSGKKWAVPGSHQGIFLPAGKTQRTGFVTEGPTDSAAALSIGLYAIGRPSCSGGMPLVITAFKRLGVTRAVVVADNDDPGLRGAEMLASHFRIPTCIFVPPSKDLRAFVQSGGTGELANSMIDSLIWKVPQ